MQVFGQHEAQTLDQLARVARRAEHAALMADGHLGYVMPIGGVAAYRNQVSVAGVGFDIACGNAAIRTDLGLNDLDDGPGGLRRSLELIGDEIQDGLSFGIGGTNKSRDSPAEHPLFGDPAWEAVPFRRRGGLRDKARKQLGTVGSGNHYVDVFADEKDRIWVGVHFGSRGFGHTVASSFLAIGQGAEWGTRAPEAEVILDLDAPVGHDYWHLMNLAGRYAYAGREWAVRKTVEIVGGREVELVHNHHNFAWEEEHFGETFVVVRKGATPAFPGQKGFVGGSMGDDSVILEGTRVAERLTGQLERSGRNNAGSSGDPLAGTDELQARALFSTVHGAGRVMSRTAARGKRRRRTGKVLKRGKVSREMMNDWMDRKGVVLRGGGTDESPHVYRRLTDVLAAQGDTVKVLHTLRPLIVVMAPER